MKHLLWMSVNCSYSHASLALPLLHRQCADIPGWEWHVLETTIEDDYAETAVKAGHFVPDLICSTLYLFNRKAVLDILSRIHVLCPESVIAVGGPECLGDGAEKILRESSFITTVFRGEGEGIFPDYLKNFSFSLPRSIEPSNGETAVYHCWKEKRLPVDDPFFRTDKPFVQIETSRGCPMGCSYCTSCHNDLRFKPLDDVQKEISLLREKGVSELRLLDRTFNFPEKRGADLLKMFRQEFPDMKFHLEIHPQFLAEEMKYELNQALPGQLFLEAGIQSLQKSVQNAINRRMDITSAVSGLKYLCSKSAFETHVDLLSGLPEQSLQSIWDDLKQLMEINPSEIQLEVLKILPGTPLRHSVRDYGIRYSPEPPYDVLCSGAMSADDILCARKISRMLDLFWNHSALHQPFHAAFLENTQSFLSDFFEFFLSHGLEIHRLFDLKKRFLILESFFLCHPEYLNAGDILAEYWIRSGYPPCVGPARNARPVRSVPDAAYCCDGEDCVRNERTTKYWEYSRHDGMTFYFAFNRQYKANLPAAVFISR